MCIQVMSYPFGICIIIVWKLFKGQVAVLWTYLIWRRILHNKPVYYMMAFWLLTSSNMNWIYWSTHITMWYCCYKALFGSRSRVHQSPHDTILLLIWSSLSLMAILPYDACMNPLRREQNVQHFADVGFRMHFRMWKLSGMEENFTELCSRWSNWW